MNRPQPPRLSHSPFPWPARLLAGATFLFVVAAPAARADAPPGGGRYALLVGVHKYSEAKELRPLPYAENDVTELAKVLGDGGYKRGNVVLMTQTTGADELRFLPMKARILKELQLLLANRSATDTVMVAFAGHGVVFKDDPASYFCPADAQLDDKQTLLSLAEVYHLLEKCPAGTKVLLVDACRNDPFTDKSRAPTKMDLDSVTRPPDSAKDGGVAAFFSCSRGQKAFEDDKSKHGAFFHFVIDGLRGEASGKDEVTLLDLCAYVTRNVGDLVRVEYGAEQKPELSGDVQGAAVLAGTQAFMKAFLQGKQFMERTDFDKAIAELTEAVRLHPQYAPAFNDRGVVWHKKGDYDKALSDFNEAIRLDPKYAFALNNRGLVWRDKGEYDKAIADFDEALGLDLRYEHAFFNRGLAYTAKKDYDKAIADFSEAVRLNPLHALAWNGRGIAWHKKGDNAKALGDYEEALRLDPKCAPAFNDRGNVYKDAKEYDKAIADYDEAIRLNPKFAVAFRNRGSAHKARGESDKAKADFDAAKQLETTK